MITFSVITVHPSFVEHYSSFGVLKRAMDQGSMKLQGIDLRDYAVDARGSVDDRPYGGGDGMVMRCEPFSKAITALKPDRVIALSPAGKKWTQSEAERFAGKSDAHIAFACGRFAGIDQRFHDLYVDEEYSLGDFIVSGGELGALLLIDSIARLLPGATHHPMSPKEDSFSKELAFGLEYPVYTRPACFEGLSVPEVLASGDHKKIAHWRKKAALERTERLRPELILR